MNWQLRSMNYRHNAINFDMSPIFNISTFENLIGI